MMIDYVLKSVKNYYPHTFSEECKYKVPVITDDLESSDDDVSEE